MFDKTTSDIAATLSLMQDQAQISCRSNQGEMVKQMGRWMQNDRRFDSISNKEALAREAMQCRAHGRVLDLTKPQQSVGNSYFGHTVRSV